MSSAAFLLAGLGVIILTLIAWLALRPKAQPLRVPAGARSGDLDLVPRTVRIGGVEYRADSGTFVVPENRSKPGSRLIALPVRRIHSPASQPGAPIFYLAGGPGMSNMGFKPDAALLAGHDVVLVGYRGADGSSVLNCPEIGAAALGDGQDVTSPASIEIMAEAMRAAASRLQAAGVDLAGYTIPEVVADMEAAREALGYERINLLSESYGTRVAQVYACLHPQRLFRSAMIGVNPPGHFVWEPATIDRQLEQYSRLSTQDPNYSQHTTDLAGSMRKVAQDMPRRWLFLRIDPGKVKIISHVMLYHRTTAALIFDAWLAAERGDPSGLALMSLAYDLMVPRIFIWGDLLAKGSSADCDPGRDYNDLRAPDSILGSPMSLMIWAPASKGWPIFPISDELRRGSASDVETLLINGSLDFSTPLEFGRDELLPMFKNGRLVTLSEMGHVNDFWSVNPPAAERLLTSFYATGQADDSGFCYLPVDFTVSLGFPALAKILTGILVLPVAAMVLELVHAMPGKRI